MAVGVNASNFCSRQKNKVGFVGLKKMLNGSLIS